MVCEEPRLHDRVVLVNPAVVVEIIGGAVSREEVLATYLPIASLLDCLIVNTDTIGVEHHRRDDSGEWLRRECGPGESVQLRAQGARTITVSMFEVSTHTRASSLR